MRKLGFGIIGLGAISPLHIEGIEACEGAYLAAVADVSEERAQLVGDRQSAPWYTDYQELLARPDVDVVCVLTPSGLRAPVCIDAARAGKHIIAEKPLEVSLQRVDSIIEECDGANVKLAVIFQVRFLPGVVAARNAIVQGRLGKLVLGGAYVKWHRSQDYYDSATWRGTWELDGGGALMNQGIHYIDLLQWGMGPVESISGRVATLIKQRIEVEDTAVACLKFANGALGVIEACTSANTGTPARLELRGEKGLIIIEDGNIVTWQVDGDEEHVAETVETGSGSTSPMAITAIGHKAQINDMVDAINQDRPPVVDGREARKSIEIISAIYQSSRSLAPVRLT
ncbi:MAG: Gfo/Idh/MocA family oxidoreductase [Armatimonadetes bacterium]|nr:Gfo/Idh/MocA family oxidoreductase [Armatimonadota bacterium]